MDDAEKEMLLSAAEELHEDMDPDALGLDDEDPMRQLFSAPRSKKKTLSFKKEPSLATPILQLVIKHGFAKTLAFGHKKKFLDSLGSRLFEQGALFQEYAFTNDFQSKWNADIA